MIAYVFDLGVLFGSPSKARMSEMLEIRLVALIDLVGITFALYLIY